jgi:PAS domain S-box-containing protein
MRNVQVAVRCGPSSWFSARALRHYVRLASLGALLCIFTGPPGTTQPKAKNVLVLVSVGRGHASIDQMESSLRARVPWPVNFSIVYLENPRFEEKSYRDSLAETLRRGYGGVKQDLVVAVSEPALLFAVQYRDKMFPGVPIVFMSISSALADQKMPGVTGVATRAGTQGTIDLALRLDPDATGVAVIANSASETDRDWLAAVHSELLRHQDKVRETDLVGPASGQMLERVAALPRHTVILFQLVPQESDQPAIGAFDVLAAAARRFPTYSIFPGLALDRGGIGGAYYDATKEPVLAAEVAAKVLSGERPDDIPIVHDTSLQIRVDWRQLQRWHIPESALPPGSLVLDRPPTLWERDREYFIPVLALIGVQFLLIITLLWQRARKRKAEAGLRESEKRFRVMADTIPALIWMCDSQGRITYLNERRIAFTGSDPNPGYGDAWKAYVHPDDLKKMSNTLAQALKTREPFSQEYRMRRSDGLYRWMFDVASPRVNGDGSFAGFIGSAIDTTDQKLAQQAIEKMSGQLIEAQEKERRRIARELHDDICQRLALLSVELDEANLISDVQSAEKRLSLEEIQKHCSEITGDIQSLSHQLHSSKLDYLGVAAAIRGFCRELSKQHKVGIEFTENGVPKNLPEDIALCLFRVSQEALHNAMKYSGMSQFTIEMTGMPDELQLLITDEGAGFDVEQARRNGGLGLLSMQERVNLVKGRLLVESTPGSGTKILAVVPLVAENRSSPEGEAAAVM